MKSLYIPAAALALLALPQLAPQTFTGAMPKEPYRFDPVSAGAGMCGPLGAKRGVFFRPELAKLLSGAVRAAEPVQSDVPLLAGLGNREFPVSSDNALAREYFRQGFALLYGFNHWEAVRAFKKAQAIDPTCAICFWGEAIALGPNINAPMSAENAIKAQRAISQAVALLENADEREQELIKAAELRYSDDPAAGRSEMDKAYADAMAGVAAKYSGDQDIATLYAEALMDTTPWDYWERDYVTPKPAIQLALQQIERVLDDNPNHYGAIHLYIHLYEATAMAAKVAPYADRLAAQAPGSGHLVHMPGHIYFRIGRYIDSLETNIKAVAVDEAYLAATQGSTLYRYGYYPHNVHFVLVSAQMAGDAALANEYAHKLDALIPMEVLAEAAWIAPIKAAPYFAFAQFGDEASVSTLPDPGDTVPYLKAMWHYARGVKMAEAGNNGFRVELDAIEALRGTEAIQNAGIPAAAILQIAENTIAAKAFMQAGEYEAALELLRGSIDIQASLPYTEPPFWYYATEQSLGAALYMAGAYSDAALAFEASLVRHPNSAWSLFGLMKSYRKLGRDEEANGIAVLYKKANRMSGDPNFIQL